MVAAGALGLPTTTFFQTDLATKPPAAKKPSTARKPSAGTRPSGGYRGSRRWRSKPSNPQKERPQKERPKKELIEITGVGQELRAYVKAVNVTKSGAAFVNVGRGRPCMLLPDDMEGEVKPEMVFPVYVKQVKSDGHVLVTMQKPKRQVESLVVGEPVQGQVTNIADFGAIFLDVGATSDGCLLVGQMDQATRERLNSGSLGLGDKVEALVKDVRPGGEFGLTQLTPRTPMSELKVGEEVSGRVLNLEPNVGAFVDIGADEKAWIPEHALLDRKLEPGQEVQAWIQEVRKDRGVQLSLEEPRLSLESIRVGSKFRGTVTGFPPFGGAFVDVGALRDGVLNKQDMVGEDGSSSDPSLTIGQEIDVWVKQRRGDWEMQLTMKKPGQTWRTLRIGQQVPGNIVGRTKMGDFFVDIGYIKQVMLRASDVTGVDLTELKPGSDVKVRIKNKHQRSQDVDVSLAVDAPKLEAPPEVRRGVL